ncbi:unnamed protein product [Nippostrongylus brasiliensis]|uniref:Helicase Helix-turn-helix domain-containing protein n=1 Tax=Nippostrongylus brasiliensis TaxID=27835 RepID=A0A3P7AIV1_NIPBR|nr:unnamed protein product [Nippostrongylus brasiliensis]
MWLTPSSVSFLPFLPFLSFLYFDVPLSSRVLGSVRLRKYSPASAHPSLKTKSGESLRDIPLVEELRRLLDNTRMELAKQYDCGPVAAMESISDLPAERRHRFGQQFVDCIKQFATENHLDTNVASSSTIPNEIQEAIGRLSPSIQQTYKAHLLTACPVEELSKIRCVSESTTWGYLCSAVEQGLPVHLDLLGIDQYLISSVLEAAREKLGGDVFRLKPLMEALPKDFIDYNRLKASSLVDMDTVDRNPVQQTQEDDMVLTGAEPEMDTVARSPARSRQHILARRLDGGIRLKTSNFGWS